MNIINKRLLCFLSISCIFVSIQQCVNEVPSLRTQPIWDFALLYAYLRYHKPKGFFFAAARGADWQLHTGAWAKLLAHRSKYEPLAGDWLCPPDSQSCYLSVFWVTRAGWQSESGQTKACPHQNIGTGVAKKRLWRQGREGDACCYPTVLSGLWAVWIHLGFILPEAR